jgi:hypothetical protein
MNAFPLRVTQRKGGEHPVFSRWPWKRSLEVSEVFSGSGFCASKIFVILARRPWKLIIIVIRYLPVGGWPTTGFVASGVVARVVSGVVAGVVALALLVNKHHSLVKLFSDGNTIDWRIHLSIGSRAVAAVVAPGAVSK